MSNKRFYKETQSLTLYNYWFHLRPANGIFLIILLSILLVLFYILFGSSFTLGRSFIFCIMGMIVLTVFYYFVSPSPFERMVTTINETELVVCLILLRLVGINLVWIKKRFPLPNIKGKEVVTFIPRQDFGGWGIKSGQFREECVGCYTLQGDKGIFLTLSNDVQIRSVKTKKIIIGSQMPERMLEAINK